MAKSVKLYAEQKSSINSISVRLGLDKMYLYRFVGNVEKVEKMPYGIVLGIANIEKIEPNDLYSKMLSYALENSRKKER